MTDLVKIAVDAMGGEGSPKKTMDGLVHNHLSKKNNYYKIFGDKAKILIALNNSKCTLLTLNISSFSSLPNETFEASFNCCADFFFALSDPKSNNMNEEFTERL